MPVGPSRRRRNRGTLCARANVRGPDRGQVVAVDQAVGGHVGNDQLGGLAGVELIRAFRGDPVKRCGKVELDQTIAALPRRAIPFAVNGHRLGKGSEPVRPAAEIVMRDVELLGIE